VIPGQPGQSGSVRARSWSGVEVAAARDHVWLGGAVGRKDDELVLRLPLSVSLPDADDQPAIREDAAVRIAEPVRLGWLRRDRLRVGAGCFDSIEPAVVEARAEHDTAVPEPGPAAVFVNASPHVEIRRDDVDGLAAVRAEHERAPAALLWATLGPVDPVLVDVEVAEGNAALACDEVSGDRRGPGAVGRGGRHGLSTYRTEAGRATSHRVESESSSRARRRG